MTKRARPKQRHHPFAPYRITDVQLFVEQAIEHHRKGKLDEAMAIYRRVLATVPNHADALHFMGLAEHQKGKSQHALELMNQAIQLAPEHADFFNNRGNVHRHLGDLAAAEVDYREAIRLAPTNANAHNNLGVVLRDRGRVEDAIQRFRDAIALEGSHGDAYQNLGNALASELRFDEALEAHRKALSYNPQNASAYRYVAGMCYATGRVSEATALYRAWLDRYPDDPVAKHMLAACTQERVPARASSEYVRATFDDFADSFDRSLERLEYRAPKHVAEALALCLGAPQAVHRIVDAGCGTGLCASMLRPYASYLEGVDMSPKMLKRAERLALYDKLVEADIVRHLGETHGQFDAIVSADTLVYFGELELVLGAFHNALAPEGAAVFTVEAEPPESTATSYRIHPHGRYSHCRHYLERTLSNCGFLPPEIREVTLRKEAGEWVKGFVVTAKKPLATTPAP